MFLKRIGHQTRLAVYGKLAPVEPLPLDRNLVQLERLMRQPLQPLLVVHLALNPQLRDHNLVQLE
jgi:hypothetical protein